MISQEDSARRALIDELSRMREAHETLRDQNEDLLEAQGLLEEARDDYSEIHDLTPLPLLTLTRTGVIRSANLAAAELLEEERSQLVGRTFPELCAAQERASIADLIATARWAPSSHPRVELTLPSGGQLFLELRLRISPRKPGVIHVTLMDASAPPEDQLIAMLSHQLRTPLAPALAMASRMTENTKLSSELRASFRMIERNLEAEARLIDQLVPRLVRALTPGLAARPSLEQPVVVEREMPNEVRGTPPQRSDSARKYCVLLLEDHEDTLEVMQEILEDQGFEVVPATSCEQALARGLEGIDVLVSDLSLTDGSALDLLPRLRETETRYVPALVLSGYGRPSDVQASKKAGFERHLTKPVDFKQLLDALGSVLPQAPAEGIVG